MRRTGFEPLAAALLCALALLGLLAATAGTAEAKGKRPLKVLVLSNRADLVSGGRALVEIKVPPGSSARGLSVTLSHHKKTRNVTKLFPERDNGRYMSNLKLLGLGENTIRARLDSARAKTEITNHPVGGPLFAGPQYKPWECQESARDEQCNQKATYEFLYKSTNPLQSGLQHYDPANPPADVAQTTTDEGVKVPFVVRQETGYQDRDQYKILTLWQPGKPWKPWAPQEQWNHKVMVTHGGGCDTGHGVGEAPLADASGTLPDNPAISNSYMTGLGRGFAVMSTALDNTGHNCNIATGAESLLMAKERIVETLGEIRYTIGTGCSGGSLAQQWIANAYPGIYQGLIPQCSFPDAVTTGAQFADYHLLRLYFENPGDWGPGVGWPITAMAAVEGHPDPVNAILADEALFKSAINPNCPDRVPADMQYDAETNPGGVRCSVLDYMINMFGPRPKSAWSPMEKAAGHGFAGLPVGNTGIQYGLSGLKSGLISPAQFVDLNAKIGGLDIDIEPQAARTEPDKPALRRAYRTGTINHANNLDTVAIINLLGPDPGAAHDTYRAFAMRQRIQREFGDHDNHVIWSGPVPLLGDVDYTKQALIAMDRWLAAVEKDKGSASLADKIANDRPGSVHDQCSDGAGQKLLDTICPRAVVDVYGTPRTVSGDKITTESNQCRLEPQVRGDYPVSFSDAQWATLQTVFPTGVCDYSKPPVGSRDTLTWLGYQHGLGGDGDVIYGGKPMGVAPKRSGRGMTSPAFSSWLDG